MMTFLATQVLGTGSNPFMIFRIGPLNG